MVRYDADLLADQSRVREYLEGVLPGWEFGSEPALQGHPPLLLVSAPHTMAAFAFLQGDPDATYGGLYGSFKEYYAANRERLDALDLSFVACVRPDVPDVEAFSSSVEADRYFCRKFVVRLERELDKSFERLPFLPLSIGARRSRMPMPAQTYMGRLGIPAALARYLAVPHQRAAESIVKECLAGTSGWQARLSKGGSVDTQEAGPAAELESVRLNSLVLRGFRGYRKPQEFDLSGDVTVLHGPNGFGKTSLFDAIDFAATGSVGRLRLSPRSARFSQALAHLDGSPEDSSVSLRIEGKGGLQELRRDVASSAEAWLDGQELDRKSVLREITGGGLRHTDRIEHVVRLFRASHLFSQEHQELVEGFAGECALRSDVVSRMLALEDYESSTSKAEEVRDVLQRRIDGTKESVDVLRREIEEARGALEELEQVAGEHDAPLPSERLSSLRERLQEEGLQIRRERLDVVFVRECRAAIEAQLSSGRARVTRLTALLEEVASSQSIRDQVADLVERQEELTAVRARAESELLEARKVQEEAEQVLGRVRAKAEATKRQAEKAHWVMTAQPRYVELIRLESETAAASADVARVLDDLREQRAVAANELGEKEPKAADLAASLSTQRALERELEALAGAADLCNSDRTRMTEIGLRQDLGRRRLEEVRREEEVVSSELAANAASRAKAEQNLAELAREQEELSGLLSSLEVYARDACCPLCGHHHGSSEALLRRIRAQQPQEATGSLRRELKKLEASKGELEARLRKAAHDAQEEQRILLELRKEREERQARVTAFERKAETLGLPSQQIPVLLNDLRERQRQVRAEASELEGAVLPLQTELRAVRTSVVDLDRRIQRAEKEHSEAEGKLSEYRANAARLREDARAETLSLDTDAAALRESAENYGEGAARAASELSGAADAAGRRAEATVALEEQVATHSEALHALKKDLGTRRRILAETGARLSEFGLPANAGQTPVVSLLEEATRTNEKTIELRELADSVEVAMDTAATAAAVRRLQRDIKKKLREIEQAEEGIQACEPWRAYFSDVLESVASRQRTAIRDFADGYGPMASAIQQRLRSVYGFQGIVTRRHKASIRVRAMRGKEALHPTDYFSQSQQQTLFLGLFLTACLSQTWSALTAVLLDDPVTHFDDLNTYAFLDLVAGLLGAGGGPSQFVISTCDERVFRLARSKFRYLGERARFFEFRAIGADGPLVEEVAWV